MSKGKELLKNLKFYDSYSKYKEDLGRKETWEESVDDVMSMHYNKFNNIEALKPYLDKATKMYKESKILASQRNLQYREEQILKSNTRLFNCFGRETEFITSEGVKSFLDFNDGDEIKVLTHKGNWKPAVVKAYGEQELNRITISKNTNTFDVYATKNHRWLTKEGDTTDLKVKDRLIKSINIFNEFEYDTASLEEKLYWCYGMVYGDGTKVKTKKDEYTHSMIRLCGHDRKYANRFVELGFSTSSPLSVKGDIIAYTGTYLKTAPNPEIDSPELIRAFVAGYLSTDGEKNRNEKTNLKYYTIQASDEDHIEFIRKCFPIAGVYIVSEKDISSEITNYGQRSKTSKFRIHQGQAKLSPYFTVEKIEDSGRYETVWCLEVEDDMSFTFPNGLHTGNCASTYIDRPEVFKQILFVLLNGCGMGYSVEQRFINKLPKIQQRKNQTITYQIEDSIQGWANALDKLVMSFFEGSEQVRFDGSLIREEGSFISGGFQAPGYEPLKKSLELIEKLLQSKINNGDFSLTSLDSHEIVCISADSVLSAGVRRSALICLFDKEDDLMLNCKTGDWFYKKPHLARANNTIKLILGEFSKEEFDNLKESIKEFGEPGIAIVKDKGFTTNPCFEIGFIPVNPKTGNSCISFCNLNEINGGLCTTKEKFFEACEGAAIIGTLQASYTNMPFLGIDTEELIREEALIGVSITGIMDNPKILLDPETLRQGAEIVNRTNELIASIIGINPAARTTCTKPSGNASVLLKTSSGIHPAHSSKYFRIMQMNKSTEMAKSLKAHNPILLEDSVWSASGNDYAVYIPIEEKEGVITKKQLNDIEFTEHVKTVYQNWVLPGNHVDRGYSSRVTHNVSNTITVNDWDAVFDYIFENQAYFCGLSFIPNSGDKIYKQAPFTEVLSFNELVKEYGEGVIFASGLIIDALHAFGGDLWDACEASKNKSFPLSGDRVTALVKKDIISRIKKFSKNYYKNDMEKTISCLKDVHLFHKWKTVNRDFKNIDFTTLDLKPTYKNINEMGGSACSAGGCEVTFI